MFPLKMSPGDSKDVLRKLPGITPMLFFFQKLLKSLKIFSKNIYCDYSKNLFKISSSILLAFIYRSHQDYDQGFLKHSSKNCSRIYYEEVLWKLLQGFHQKLLRSFCRKCSKNQRAILEIILNIATRVLQHSSVGATKTSFQDSSRIPSEIFP